MSRHRTVATWSAGLLATAAAALLTASATLPGSAAHLRVDGGVLQVFVLDGPEGVTGPPGGLPPDGVGHGPTEGVPGGPPDGVVTGPTGDGTTEDSPTGPQNPSGEQPSDKPQQPDEPPVEPDQPGEPDPSHSDTRTSEQDTNVDGSSKAAATSPATKSEVRYENCAEARDAGAAPVDSADPGYRPELDDDRDGRACEEGEG